MFKNNFKIAWRNLIKTKGYSAINIGGLAVGMAVAMLISLWVYDELSFNTYHKNYDHIAQVMQHANFNGEVKTQVANPAVMGPELQAKFGSDFKHIVQASWGGDYLIGYEDKLLTQTGNYMDAGAPDMLSLDMVQGSYNGLEEPYSIMLSVSTAKALWCL